VIDGNAFPQGQEEISRSLKIDRTPKGLQEISRWLTQFAVAKQARKEPTGKGAEKVCTPEGCSD